MEMDGLMDRWKPGEWKKSISNQWWINGEKERIEQLNWDGWKTYELSDEWMEKRRRGQLNGDNGWMDELSDGQV